MTIVAISTAPGVGGIAVLRLSGPTAVDLARRYVRLPDLATVPNPYVTFSRFVREGSLLDEVVVSVFRAPHSYTGEDVVEVSFHGSLYLQQALLQCFLDAGARLAEPGEFTRRAFLNGKLDLSQAEAVADLIDATNSAGHELAVSQLRGGYSRTLADLRQQLVDLTALLELELDFSDEDVEFADRSRLNALLSQLQREVHRLCRSFSLGNAIKNGIPVAILGRPNVGKSTLLNALLQEERAIVSDIPGTTRDTIEDTLVIGGFRFRIVDTAGIRQSDDRIETIGIERSYAAAQQARLLLYLVEASDSSAFVCSELESLNDRVPLHDKRLLLVSNKSDCLHATSEASPSPDYDHVAISALEGRGVDNLKQWLLNAVSHHEAFSAHGSSMVSNMRHYEALKRVGETLALVREDLDAALPADLVVVDLREALHYLGTITGQITSDEVLGSIFSRFCIGK